MPIAPTVVSNKQAARRNNFRNNQIFCLNTESQFRPIQNKFQPDFEDNVPVLPRQSDLNLCPVHSPPAPLGHVFRADILPTGTVSSPEIGADRKVGHLKVSRPSFWAVEL